MCLHRRRGSLFVASGLTASYFPPPPLFLPLARFTWAAGTRVVHTFHHEPSGKQPLWSSFEAAIALSSPFPGLSIYLWFLPRIRRWRALQGNRTCGFSRYRKVSRGAGSLRLRSNFLLPLPPISRFTIRFDTFVVDRSRVHSRLAILTPCDRVKYMYT